jgi:ABC-type nitrate/sulfonate/bicarbonate transport system permease component
MSRPLLNVLLPAVIGVLMIELWFYFHFALNPDNRFLLPRPDQIITAMLDNRTDLTRATLNTLEGALLGFLSAAGISFLLSLGLSFSSLVRVSFYPYLMILQMTPVIVFAPILVLWVGPGLKSVIVITFLICFFACTDRTAFKKYGCCGCPLRCLIFSPASALPPPLRRSALSSATTPPEVPRAMVEDWAFKP